MTKEHDQFTLASKTFYATLDKLGQNTTTLDQLRRDANDYAFKMVFGAFSNQTRYDEFGVPVARNNRDIGKIAAGGMKPNVCIEQNDALLYARSAVLAQWLHSRPAWSASKEQIATLFKSGRIIGKLANRLTEPTDAKSRKTVLLGEAHKKNLAALRAHSTK